MANKLAKSSSSPIALEETRYPYLDQNLIEFISRYRPISCFAPVRDDR